MPSLSDRALHMLTRHSLPVLPTTEYRKHPHYKYEDFIGDRSGEIPGLWEEHAETATGAHMRCENFPEGYFVLDCDWSEDHYFQEFAEGVGLDLTELTAVRTVSGGMHLYLKQEGTVRLPVTATVKFSDGQSRSIDIRCAGHKTALMLPGSKAKSKTGALGQYEALGEGTEDAVFNLKWSTISEAQRGKIEELLGSRQSGEAGEGDGSAVGAVLAVVENLLPQLRDGFDTNDVCTTLANLLGMMIRTHAPANILAEELWDGILAVSPRKVADQLTGDPRHKTSFIRNATRSIELTQERQRALIAEARHPVLATFDDDTEKLVYDFFGGGVGVILAPEGSGRFAFLRGAGHARLDEQDWDNPSAIIIERDCLFGASGGLTWFQSILVELKLQSKEVPNGFEADLKSFLIRNSISDEVHHQEELRKLREALKAFSKDEWEAKRDALPESKKARWLWHMATPDTRGRKKEPFVAVVDGEEVIAVPPACSLSAETKGMLGKPLGDFSAKNKKKIHYYAIPEGLRDEDAA